MDLPEVDIDVTGAELHPGDPERCQGNGEHPDFECCCDNCDYWYECHPEPKILFNRARCRKCGTFLESKNEHDLQTCACGAISIDGGRKYIRQLAKDLNDIEDLTEYVK